MTVALLPVRREAHISAAESISDTMRRLRTEAQGHAREHSLIMEQAIVDLEALAAEIADGGEAYLSGVRETARRLIPELTNARMQLDSMLGRKSL